MERVEIIPPHLQVLAALEGCCDQLRLRVEERRVYQVTSQLAGYVEEILQLLCNQHFNTEQAQNIMKRFQLDKEIERLGEGLTDE